MQLLHPFRQRRADKCADNRLHKRAIESEIDLGQARRRCEPALVADVVATERANIIERSRLATHDPIAGHKVLADRVLSLALEHRLIEAGRQGIDQIDVAREFAVLLSRYAGGYKDAQMSHGLMNGVDDGLSVGADFVDVLVEIENPSEGLLGRRDVVAFRAEHHDRRADVAKIDGHAIRGLYKAGGELVADEEFIDDELNLLGIEIDVASPPALEAEIARCFGIDLGIEVVLLAPERVCRVLILEILHQPGAIELAVAEVAGKRGEPAAAEKAAAIAHRVLAAHAGPVGEWRARDDDRAEQFR